MAHFVIKETAERAAKGVSASRCACNADLNSISHHYLSCRQTAPTKTRMYKLIKNAIRKQRHLALLQRI